jgi:hypothetical protein
VKAPALAWALVAATVLFLAGHLAFWPLLGSDHGDAVFRIASVLLTFAFGVPAILILGRQPRNGVGWLLITIPLMAQFAFFVGDYATYSLVASPGALPGGRGAAWIDRWAIVPALSMFIPLFLLFPDGRVPSPRWRPVLWLVVAAPTVATLAFALTPGPLTGAFADLESVRVVNPLGLDALKGPVDALTQVGGAGTALAAFLAGASLLVRFRSRGGVERQQIKWLAFVGIVFLVELLLAPFVDPIGDAWFGLMFFTLVLGIPAACAVAILKYRLYEIDRIVNRTVVYVLVSAVLAGVYVGLAVGLGSLSGSDNSLVVAGSTLVVAALFRPVRGRIQALIDRRFYRRKYDATRTLEAFSVRLRGEIDLDELSEHLVAVVQETMQPAQAGLWLRGAAR